MDATPCFKLLNFFTWSHERTFMKHQPGTFALLLSFTNTKQQLWDKQRWECGLAWFLKKPQVQNTVSITDGFWVIHRGAKIEMQITDYNVLAAFVQNRFRVYMSFPVVEFFWTGMRNVGKTVFNVVNFPKWRYLNQQVNNSCFYDSPLPFRLDACLT